MGKRCDKTGSPVDNGFITCATSSAEYAALNEPGGYVYPCFQQRLVILVAGRCGRSFECDGVAVADLRITDAALTEAQVTLRSAGNRLAPVVRTLQGLDTAVVGADPLIGKLQDAQELLGAELGMVGQALAELADHTSEISVAFTQADQQLSQAAGAAP